MIELFSTSGGEIEDIQGEVKKKRRGRPLGRKNNKTLEKEAREREAGIIPKSELPKRGRGRPKGRKDSFPRKRRTNEEIRLGIKKIL